MSKRKAVKALVRQPKKINTSADFGYCQPVLHLKIRTVSATTIGKRPIYWFFIDYNGESFLLRCMLDLGSTSCGISPGAAKTFAIPVVKRPLPMKSGDVSETSLKTENLFTVLLGISFSNYPSYNKEDYASEPIKSSKDYDAFIPAWYLEKHQAGRTTTNPLHLPHCPSECNNDGKIHLGYSIIYDSRTALNDNAIHIGAIVMSSPSLLHQPPVQCHMFLLLFNPKETAKPAR